MARKVSNSQLQSVCLMIIAAVMVTYLIYWLRPVLVPFVVAVFVVSGVTPVLEFLENKLRVNRWVAAGITFLAGLLLMGLLGVSLWISALQLAENAQAYRSRVTQIVVTVDQYLDFGRNKDSDETATDRPSNQGSNNLAKGGEPSPTEQSDDAEDRRSDIDSESIYLMEKPATAIISPEEQSREKAMAKFLEFLDGYLRDGVKRISTELIGLISTSVVVLIYVFFLILGRSEVKRPVGTIREIDMQIRSYLSLKTIISVFTGLFFGLTLHLFGVPMAVTFGVLAFLLNYIPNIGPVVASLLPIPFIVLQGDASIVWMVTVIAVTFGIQVISGNVIEPQMMGDSSDLHPVVVLLALMFWGMMWGITGMFLATPITSGIKIVFEQFEPTKMVAAVLAGRWQKLGIDQNQATA